MTHQQTVSTAALIDAGILEIGDGYRAKNTELAKTGVPFARAQNLNNGFDFTNADLFPRADLVRVGNKVSRPGDCVLTSKGSVGRVGFVTTETPEFVYSPQLSYWRSLAPEKLVPLYLRYWLQSPDFVVQCNRVKGSTDMADYVNLRDQRRMLMTVPPVATQHKIASILSAYDDLIDNNQRRIALTEEMAQRIYREWFVDFRYPGHDAAPRVESDHGPIPGWTLTTLGCVGKWYSGGTPSTSNPEYWGGGIPWITSGVLLGKYLLTSERTLTDAGVAHGSRLVPRDTILFVVRGMSLAKEFRFGIAERVLAFGQDCKAIQANQDVRPIMILHYLWERAPRIAKMVEFAAHGTGKLSTDRLMALPFTIPPQALQRRFEDVAGDIRKLVTGLIAMNEILRTTRDYLLPHLITGDVEVEDASIQIPVVA